jgi:hypothetical protein
MSHSGKSSREDARQGFLLGVTLIVMDRPCRCSYGWCGEEMQCGWGTRSSSRSSVWDLRAVRIDQRALYKLRRQVGWDSFGS